MVSGAIHIVSVLSDSNGSGNLYMDRIRVAVLHAHLILKTLKYAFIKQEAKGVFIFRFQIIIDVLVSSFCFIRIPMLWVYGR